MPDPNPGLMTVFTEALERSDPALRAAYLERACGGDADLRRRVEELLSADPGIGRFLELDGTSAHEPSPPDATGTFDPSLATGDFAPDAATGTFGPDSHRPKSLATGDFAPDGATGTFGGTPANNERSAPTELGTVIAGRYTLVKVIGEGGMGSVYLATQTEPVKRRVALKLIKAGMDSKGVLARFDAERQALAMMDHPNIARIYDGGVTDRGQPFFVMELVKGVPLTEYCDSKRLTVAARLQLFVQVCNAVQHAHQKGIIHRDLKPGNVLVTEVDGRPTPKVIDFGVAKATELKLTDQSFADTGAIVGTPAYMSPEQADPTSMDIDTRTDVYALGVMLYELLTGLPPIDSKQFKRGAILEMLRMVREVESPRPSTKLNAADALPNIAANRSTEPAKLAKLLRGELDWVVMKALEKDRTRRYDTANGLARDIQRYLADEVVEARPPSRGYRLKKFVKRNKIRVIAASLVLLALVGGVVGTSLGMIEARREAGRADQQAEKATAEAKRAKEAADGEAAQKKIAEDKAKEADDKASEARLAGAAEKRAKDVAVRLAAKEAEAKEQAQEQLNRAEWSVYAGKLLLAQAAFRDNNVLDALRHLDECQWNLRGWEHAHLRWRFDSSKQTLRGHTNGLSCVAWSPDGRHILTGSWDRTVKQWDAEKGTEVRAFIGNTHGVTSVEYSPDGKRILTESEDLKARVWDAQKGTELFVLRDQSGVAFSPDGQRILSRSRDNSVKVWDAQKGTEILTLKGSRGKIIRSLFSPNGKRILTLGQERTMKVWDAETGTEVLTLNHTGGTFCMAWSPDGQRILAGSWSEAKVWDAEKGTEVCTLEGHTAGVQSVAFSPDGQRILTGSQDGTAKVWDAHKANEVLTLKGHTSWVKSVAWSPDGQRILTGSQDGTAKVWDAQKGREGLTLSGHTNGVKSVAFRHDGQRILTGSYDWTARMWDAQKGAELLVLKGHTNTVTSVAFSPNGQRILTGSEDNTANVWDAEKGTSLLYLVGHTKSVNSVAWSPDGQRILTGSYDNTAKVWDAQKGTELLTLRGHKKGMTSVAWSPDGQRIVTGSYDNTAKVWDAQKGTEILTIKGSMVSTDYIICVAFSPDGQRILAGGLFGTVHVWDAQKGTELLTLRGHTQLVSNVAWSPNSQRILTSSGDRTARVWDAQKGTELMALKGHTQSVDCAIFSPDGQRILTGSYDKTAKVWDAQNASESLSLRGHSLAVSSVAFSPNSRRILTGAWDNTAKVWDAEKGIALLDLKGHKEGVRSVAYSPDGQRILTGSGDFDNPGEAKIWDAETGIELLSLNGHISPVTSVGFSPDGKRAFVRDKSYRVLAWSVEDGKPVPADNPPSLNTTNSARSSDGRYVARPEQRGGMEIGGVVKIVDLHRPVVDTSPWPLPDAAERKAYHIERAVRAEKEKQWFGVAFHVGRLLLDDPGNADLKKRRDEALKQLDPKLELAPPREK